ncbi:MAG: glycosyl hydrolase family 28-related protein, partial [Kiritimatiellia bacterium]
MSKSLYQNQNEFNIIRYGAVKGGQTLCTGAFQEAIDTCSNQKGGRVVVPPGTWLTGTIVMKDNVELHLAAGATILGSMNQEDYLTSEQNNLSHKINNHFALIYAKKAEHIAITGTGVIDGQRKHQYP